MLNYHTQDYVIAAVLAAATATGGFFIGKHFTDKRHKKDREANWLKPEAAIMPENETLTDGEISAWADFNTHWNTCANTVEWKDDWMQDGGRIIPDYWNERGNIEETKTARCDRFTDRYGRRGLMVRISATDGFVVYEAYISKDGKQPVVLTTLSETYSASHAKPWLDALAVVLQAQNEAAEAEVKKANAASAVNEAVNKAAETASAS